MTDRVTRLYGASRPRNESEEDLRKEYAAMRRIEKWTGATGLKLSENLYHIDWAFHRGDTICALGEYKWRSRQIDPYIISVSKMLAGKRLSKALRVPFFLFIEWEGLGLHMFRASPKESFGAIIAGNSRGQTGDVEPCFTIPVDQFEPLPLLP